MIRILTLLAAVIWSVGWSCPSTGSLSAADASAVIFDRDNRDLQLVDDKDCASGKALELRFKSKAVAKGALPVMQAPINGTRQPGLYRATVRLKMQGMLHSLGTGINLGACGWDAKGKRADRPFVERIYYLNDFAAEDAWQDFTLDFEVRPGDVQRHRIDGALFDALCGGEPPGRLAELARWFQDSRLPAERLAALRQWFIDHPRQALPTKDAPAGLSSQQAEALNRLGASPDSIAIAISLPPGGDRGHSAPVPSLRRLYVDTVAVVRLPEPPIVVRDVRAQKAWLRPGEAQAFDVDLHNRSGAAQSGRLLLSVEAGLDVRVALPPVAVALKDGEYTTVTVDWQVPATHRQWGQTAIASVELGGKAVSSWRTWFTVHPRVASVMIPWMRTYDKESCNFQHPTASKPNVANLLEYWAPTPYDAAGMVPEDPQGPFMAGNSAKVESLVSQSAEVTELKARGVASVYYCEGHGTGLKAWDTYWNHPEWCAPSEPTSDLFYQKRRDAWNGVRTWYLQGEAARKQKLGLPLSADEVAAQKEPRVDRMPDIVHTGFVKLNCLVPQVLNTIIRGSSDLLDQVPYIGCRWDSTMPLVCYNTDALGRNLGKTQAELEQANLQNLQRYLREIRAKHPEFEVGFNGGHSQLMGKREDPFDFEAAKRVLDSDPISTAILADGGYILEESWGHSFEVWNDYKIIARNYLRACRAESAAYKHAGGQHGHMFRDNAVEYTPDDIYQQLFSLLGGAHLTLVNYGPIPESRYDLGVWAARFGEFFWDPQLRQLGKLEDKIRVETEADIWSTEAGFEKDTAAGTRQYILPLINPPVTDRWLKNRYGVLPAPIRKPLVVTVVVPDGFTGVKAVYNLENDPWPEVKLLTFESDGKEVRFELPELVTFKVVVVEFSK